MIDQIIAGGILVALVAGFAWVYVADCRYRERLIREHREMLDRLAAADEAPDMSRRVQR